MCKNKIEALNEEELSEVLKVVSTYQINDAMKRMEDQCNSYKCCPCDVQRSDQCTCHPYCTCENNGEERINTNIAEIYESLRDADRIKIDSVIGMLKKRQSLTTSSIPNLHERIFNEIDVRTR